MKNIQNFDLSVALSHKPELWDDAKINTDTALL